MLQELTFCLLLTDLKKKVRKLAEFSHNPFLLPFEYNKHHFEGNEKYKIQKPVLQQEIVGFTGAKFCHPSQEAISQLLYCDTINLD